MLQSITARLTPQLNKSEEEGTTTSSTASSVSYSAAPRLSQPQQSFVEFIESNMPPHSVPSAPVLINRQQHSSSPRSSASSSPVQTSKLELTPRRKDVNDDDDDVADDGRQRTRIETPPSSSSCGGSLLMSSPKSRTPLVPPTISLPILVMIDMFSVSLVVPLLFQYYKRAGVTDASQRELLSSVFSTSQIVGGLVLGAMADSGWVYRRTILFVSFAGSALSYALIVYGGLPALVVSRILVGAVKQTMTITTTMLTHVTTRDDRARHMGRLNASSTVAWIFGPSVGAILYKTVDHRAPALLASALFCLNIILAAVLLPHREDHVDDEDGNQQQQQQQPSKSKSLTSFSTNLRSCFSSKALGSVITSYLIYTFAMRATSYASLASYYEQMYGMESYQRGYLSSYQQTLSFIVQSVLVGPLLTFVRGERRAVVVAALLLTVATFLELQQSLPFFLLVLCPAIALSMTLMNLSLRSLVTHVAPKESMGSVLAALDVLQNATAVSVPFYRTMLFAILGAGGGTSNNNGGNDRDTSAAIMKGDPNPSRWVASSGFHWLVAALIMACLLLSPDRQDEQEEKRPKKKT